MLKECIEIFNQNGWKYKKSSSEHLLKNKVEGNSITVVMQYHKLPDMHCFEFTVLCFNNGFDKAYKYISGLKSTFPIAQTVVSLRSANPATVEFEEVLDEISAWSKSQSLLSSLDSYVNDGYGPVLATQLNYIVSLALTGRTDKLEECKGWVSEGGENNPFLKLINQDVLLRAIELSEKA